MSEPQAPASLAFRVVQVVGLLLFVSILPTVLYVPLGRRVFWTVLIPLLPVVVVGLGFYLWRRVCPLAVFGQLGQLLGAPGSRKAGDWLGTHYPYVQLAVLVLALSLRLLGANGTPWALAALLCGLAAAAVVTSFVYTGKTWCNFFCPVGIIEKIYTEPRVRLDAQNSHCKTCTACKRYCPDIDLEHGYWKEADGHARRVVYFAWPGIVLGFYAYFYLSSGGWHGYFSGDWTREEDQAQLLLASGFTFAPFVPRVVAAPFTLVFFGALSYSVFALGEKIARARATWSPREPHKTAARIRHRSLALAAFVAFLLFYLFAAEPTLGSAPWWLKRALEATVVLAATGVLFQRWNRREEDYVREKFARGILARWEWGDEPPSQNLADIYLIHTERTRQREARLRAYKDTVRDMITDGVMSGSELVLLDKMRVQLGVGDKEHEKILAELSIEEKKLFDPNYRGSIEERLSRDQYRRDLERLVLSAASEGRPLDGVALDALQKEHQVPGEEHGQALAALCDPGGPIAAKAAQEIDEMVRSRRALRRARETVPPGEHPSSLAFFSYLTSWRQEQNLERALSLLSVVHPDVGQARALLASKDGDTRQRGIELLATIQDSALLARLVALLGDPDSSLEPPPGPQADAQALLAMAQDSSPYVRASVAYLLSRSGDEAALEQVAMAVRDEEALVRETAVRALSARGRLTREAVQRAMSDPDPRVGQAAKRKGQSPAESAGLEPAEAGDAAPYATLDPRATLSMLSTLEKMMLMRNVPLFSSLEPDDLEVLTTITTEKRYPEGQDLCREGEESDDVFLVVRGQTQAWVRMPGGEKQVLGESGDGSCIGEMAALDQAPRSASVTATASTRVLVLAGKEFRQLLLDRPAISQSVLGVLVRRLREVISRSQKSGLIRTGA